MTRASISKIIVSAVSGFAGLLALGGGDVRAADHDDTPELKAAARHDARLTDLHVFRGAQGLVVALSTNPTIVPGQTQYQFPSDLSFSIFIDTHSKVTFDDERDRAEYGGTIVDPAGVDPDIEIEVTFDARGTARFECSGGCGLRSRSRFAGLRDDPFIRGPRAGRNVASIVVELPLDRVFSPRRRTALVWATSHVPDIAGPISEHAGRALRSQFTENLALNTLTPSAQWKELGMRPDVVIYNVDEPAKFPNGRALEDDVVDLVNDPRVLSTDAPYPATNDVPFLATFPYLAPPQ